MQMCIVASRLQRCTTLNEAGLHIQKMAGEGTNSYKADFITHMGSRWPVTFTLAFPQGVEWLLKEGGY